MIKKQIFQPIKIGMCLKATHPNYISISLSGRVSESKDTHTDYYEIEDIKNGMAYLRDRQRATITKVKKEHVAYLYELDN